MAKVCILAAGKGSRLGELTDKINKALLPIDNKAVISHIIEKFPEDSEFVIAVGYHKDTLIEYLNAAYPNLKVTFVYVYKYEGEGSGPGTSMNFCRNWLQEPFYLTTSDCIVTNDLPDLSKNWVGTCRKFNNYLFATVKQDEYGNVVEFQNKSFQPYENAYIGLAGIKDYESFWKLFDEYSKSNADKEVENISPFYKLRPLQAEEMSWLDTGTFDNYQYTKTVLEQSKPISSKKKIDEITYKCNDKIIKIFCDYNRATSRLKRYESLVDLTPTINYRGKNTISYDWIEGNNLYNIKDLHVYDTFLNWCEENLWKNTVVYEHNYFKKCCEDFYKNKTYERLNSFLKTRHNYFSSSLIINGQKCKPIEDYLRQINWDNLTNGIYVSPFHGDLNFSNAIYGNNRFYLIDWRESFSRDIIPHIQDKGGDIYYDYAKLYAGTELSWELLNNKKFSITHNNVCVDYFYKNEETLEQFKDILITRLVARGANLHQVQLLATLTYINMCPLHEEYFSDFLYFYAIRRLSELL